MLAPTRQTSSQSVARAARTRHVVHEGLTWIDIVNPGPAEIAFLRDHYPFHPLNLDDCLSKTQRPKLDSYPEEQHFFLVVHFPVFDRDQRLPISGEIDIFVGQNYLVTVHDGRLKPLSRMLNVLSVDDKARAQLMSRGTGYVLYRMLDALVKYCFPMLGQIDTQLEAIESTLFQAKVRRTVEEISFVRRDIIALRRILRPDIALFRQLESNDFAFLELDEDSYFGDISDGINRCWDILEEQNEIIGSFNATLDSLTSNRINEIIKILTVISVVLLPLTLIASLYGMNVALPYSESPAAFVGIGSLMLLLAIGMIVYFRRTGWL
jgi:magnesium transporter